MSDRFDAEAILRAAASGAIPSDGDLLVRGPDGWFFGAVGAPSDPTDPGGGAPGGGGNSFTDLVDTALDFQINESSITQHEAALSLLFTQLTDEIADDQVPLSAVKQHEAQLEIQASKIKGLKKINSSLSSLYTPYNSI